VARREDGGPIGIGALFETHAERRQSTIFHLSRPFDIAPEAGTRFDVEALAGLVAEAAGWLHAAGAREGDRVAVVKENHWDCVLLACAASRLGAVPAMISGALPPAALRVLLERLRPTVIVASGRILAAARFGRVALDVEGARVVDIDGESPAAVPLDDLRGEPTPPPRLRRPDEPMIVTHTSGTTGVPKLVAHSANTIVGVLGRTESIRWPIVATRRDDTVASAIAFVHGRSVPWTTGTLRLEPRAAVIVADPAPECAERAFATNPPTTVEALPNWYIQWEPLTVGQGGVFANVRLYVSTFDAMHPPTVRKFLAASGRRFPVWLQGWGQTETGPLAFRLLTRRALSRTGDRHPTTRDVGRPIPFFMGLRVVEPDTMRPVGAGRPGVVLARTGGRCLTYIGEEERWRRKVEGSWWNTGDVGVRTRTGSIRLLDREVDVVPGLSCIELEDVLSDRLPAAREIVILGVRDRLPLPVVCTDDGELDPAAWAAAVRDLPPLADPIAVTWDQVPRTGTGKVRRQELREHLVGDSAALGTGRWT
jgi:acyl-coenzyme A synthetase/AMP-(fatty) acid ligase